MTIILSLCSTANASTSTVLYCCYHLCR